MHQDESNPCTLSYWWWTCTTIWYCHCQSKRLGIGKEQWLTKPLLAWHNQACRRKSKNHVCTKTFLDIFYSVKTAIVCVEWLVCAPGIPSELDLSSKIYTNYMFIILHTYRIKKYNYFLVCDKICDHAWTISQIIKFLHALTEVNI